MHLTQSRLKELLHYDPDTGHFTRRVVTSIGTKIGDVAGCLCRGYIHISVDDKDYRAHRLAWLYVYGKWPNGQIDHADGNRANNIFSNLRLATASQNAANRPARCDNIVGFKGVSKSGPRYRAYIRLHGKAYYLGTFPTPELAHAAYAGAAKVLFGEFARVG